MLFKLFANQSASTSAPKIPKNLTVVNIEKESSPSQTPPSPVQPVQASSSNRQSIAVFAGLNALKQSLSFGNTAEIEGADPPEPSPRRGLSLRKNALSARSRATSQKQENPKQ